jgi:hypothetical protein
MPLVLHCNMADHCEKYRCSNIHELLNVLMLIKYLSVVFASRDSIYSSGGTTTAKSQNQILRRILIGMSSGMETTLKHLSFIYKTSNTIL